MNLDCRSHLVGHIFYGMRISRMPCRRFDSHDMQGLQWPCSNHGDHIGYNVKKHLFPAGQEALNELNSKLQVIY